MLIKHFADTLSTIHLYQPSQPHRQHNIMNERMTDWRPVWVTE